MIRARSSSPPFHVHVDESTPVHVHVKTKRQSLVGTPQVKTRQRAASMRPPARAKVRAPWIPPGKVSVRDSTIKWEGPRRSLEIIPSRTERDFEFSHSALRLADLRSQAEPTEEDLNGQINHYLRRIDGVLTEVISLKNEMEIRKQQQEETAQDNLRFHQSMGRSLEEYESSRQQDEDALLRKLTEAEQDGHAAVTQVSALRDSVTKLCSADGNFLNADEPSSLARHKDLLLQKLDTFEETNRSLRHLLRERHSSQPMESTRLSVQKDSLMSRLTDTETENAQMVVRLQETDREMKRLCKLLDAEKETVRNTSNISQNLEETRAHLQGQLRRKEAENERLTVQIKNLDRATQHERVELEHLRTRLRKMKMHAGSEQEALRRATRAHKQRADRSEEAAARLGRRLLGMEKQVSETLSAAEAWQRRLEQETKDKSQLEAQLMMLNRRIVELTEQRRGVESQSRADKESLMAHLNGLNTETMATKMENQKLKAASCAVEDRLALSLAELHQVKASIREYESLVDSYKLQVQKTRAEADEYQARMAEAERRAEAARGELLGRLAELEPLPEALRHMQLQLQEVKNKERCEERRSLELGTTLADLRLKAEAQGSQMELVKQRNQVLMEENRQLQLSAQSLERKLEEASSRNAELQAIISKREETICGNQLRVDEKALENTVLNRRLEEALSEARQQISDTRERAAARERSTQARIVELETQLSRTATEVRRLKHSKDETELQFRSKLQDMKDRLGSTDITNRRLHDHVEFLKSSHSALFDDNAAGRSPQAPSSI
ncbi:unnamed protein product [Ophioblennius macclurei]